MTGRSIALFVAAAIAEIGGAYLVALGLYGVVALRHGRARYAASASTTR